jgi:beta-glucosidase
MSDFRDPAAPLRARVDDLLAKLTLDEKLALLHQHQPAVERLGLARFTTGTEALHGLAWLGEATVFPQAVGLGASWDVDLVRAVGDATGDEVRGLHHKDPTRCGLNVWAPVVNPLRDPRWGRNEEGYGEDAFLTATLGTAYARGLRGDHQRYLKTAPTLKHFLGYNNETDRCTSSSNLTPRVLNEYELRAFRPAIESGAAVAVMASYNLVNGRPAHVSPHINDDLRTWTHDEVFVVSDAYAPSNLAGMQAFYPDHAVSHAEALRAGIDSFTDGDARSEVTVERFREAVERGLVDESDVDRAVRRALTVRMRLGEFDPPEDNPYAGIMHDVINSPEHQALARRAATESVVLLKSQCRLLPLDPGKTRSLAVIGPLADRNYTDWYSGTQPYAVTVKDGLAELFDTVVYAEGVDRIALKRDGRYLAADEHGVAMADEPCGFDVFDWGQGVATLRSSRNGRFLRAAPKGAAGAAAAGAAAENQIWADSEGPKDWVVGEMWRLVELGDGRVQLHHHESPGNTELGALQEDLTLGTDPAAFDVEMLADGASQASAAAASADAAVVVLGNHPLVNGRETEDRVDLALPPAQEDLLRDVYAAQPATALVLVSSYPYGVMWADVHLPAVLWTSHGGQEMGHAVADVLTGRADPGGRLPQTWYRSACELPDILDYDIVATDATYLYYRGTPLYPFGHGLSYADFAYEDIQLGDLTAAAGDTVAVSFTVTNAGDRPGTEVVQLYTHQQRSRVKQPLRQLRGFRKLRLSPGESARVEMPIRIDDLAFWDVTTGRMVVEAARTKVMVGRSSTDIRLTATLTVRGTVIGTRRAADRPVRAVDSDEYSGTATTDAGVQAVENGAWLCFQGIDTTGVRAAHVDGHGGTVCVRADDPFSGPLLAALLPGQRAQTAAVDGVHDVYVVFDSAGTTITELVCER